MGIKPPKGQPFKKGEPLKLACGGLIIPTEDGVDIKSAEDQAVEAEIEALLEDPFAEIAGDRKKRTLADLPLVKSSNTQVTFLTLALDMWGLETPGIARYLNLTHEQVEYIKNTDLFVQLRKEIFESIKYTQDSLIHGYLADKAKTAAVTIAKELVSKDGDRRLRAAQDILDRSGFRPVDRVDHTVMYKDELRIVRMQEKEVPFIPEEL